MRRNSPVGSRGKVVRSGPADCVASSASADSSDARSAAALKRSPPAGRAEHVAVVHERFAVGAQPFLAAVLHRGKQAARAQLRRHGMARLREALRVGAADRDQQEARGHAAAHLLEQELLRGARRRRQEGAEVGDHAGARELPAAQHAEPGARWRPRAAAAYFPSCRMDMTELSPPLSSTSMRCSRAPAPESAIDSTWARSCASRGASCSCHAWRAPENFTR